jgi:hypothetical protein
MECNISRENVPLAGSGRAGVAAALALAQQSKITGRPQPLLPGSHNSPHPLLSERIIEENRCLKLQLSKTQAAASAAHDHWRIAPVASILQAPAPPPIEGKVDKNKGEKRLGEASSVKLPMFDILNTPVKVQEPYETPKHFYLTLCASTRCQHYFSDPSFSSPVWLA